MDPTRKLVRVLKDAASSEDVEETEPFELFEVPDATPFEDLRPQCESLLSAGANVFLRVRTDRDGERSCAFEEILFCLKRLAETVNLSHSATVGLANWPLASVFDTADLPTDEPLCFLYLLSLFLDSQPDDRNTFETLRQRALM